jgi:glycine dehydrogenase
VRRLIPIFDPTFESIPIMPDTTRSLDELETQDEFIARHIGPDSNHIEEMLRELGVDSMQALVAETVPQAIVSDTPSALPRGLGEKRTLERLRKLADRNQILVSMIGMGFYDTVMPGVIQRNVLENPGWYTAYTPYQAEVSQGRLEAVLNYQQMVMDLTGLDLANASLLDEASAAAEAMTMAKRLSKSKSMQFFVDADCHPQTIAVVKTRARPLDIEVVVGDADTDLDGTKVFGILLQYPGSSGAVRDIAPAIARAKESGALACVATDLLSLCLLKSPGELGADIVLGNSQRFGVRRTRPSSPPATPTSVPPRGESSGFPWIPPDGPLCAWRCRPVSSIFAARRPPATSAPRRCCSRSSRDCTPSITDPKVSDASPSACTE